MKKLIIIAFCLTLYASGAMAASFADGAMAYNSKNYALAYKEIAPLAQGGNADADHLLGLMYYMGRGVPGLQAGLVLAPQGGAAGQGRRAICGRRDVLHGQRRDPGSQGGGDLVPQGGRAGPRRGAAGAGADVSLSHRRHAAG